MSISLFSPLIFINGPGEKKQYSSNTYYYFEIINRALAKYYLQHRTRHFRNAALAAKIFSTVIAIFIVVLQTSFINYT